jgi:penicillin G amidase
MDIKKKNKIKQIIRWFSATVIICILALIILISSINRYDKSGKHKFSTLENQVQVIRDDKNLAYIYGQSILDAIKIQGYITAQDRLFQLMLTRLFVTGRISELAGKTAVDLDIKNRTLGFYRNALKHEKILNRKNRDLLQAYTDGINAYINKNPDEIPLEFKLAGIKSETWNIADSLAIIYYMGWNSAANLETEILSFLILNKIGFERFKTIAPTQTGVDGKFISPPLQNSLSGFVFNDIQNLDMYLNDKNKAFKMGSNNWVVNGQLSKSGKPILANDPHLDARILPGVFHPVGLITPKMRAVGVTVSGIPGVIIGRNQYVTVGMTNSYGDAQDLYLEQVDPENKDRYLEGSKSIAFEIIPETIKYRNKNSPTGFSEKNITIRLTKRGPVITDIYDDLPKNIVLSVRWAAFESMLPELGIDYLLTAKNTKDVRDTLEDVNVIHINFTFADIHGNIGWQTTGKLPIRKYGDGTIPVPVEDGQDNWSGWIPYQEMPQHENPQSNWLGNTNNKTISADFPHYITSYFSPYYRYERLRQLIEDGHQKHDASDFWNYQRDILNVLAMKTVPKIVRVLQNSPETQILAQVLKNWDFKDREEDVGPVVFHYLFEKMAELTFRDELGEKNASLMLKQWHFWLEQFEKMISEGSSTWFDDIDTSPKVEGFGDIVLQAARLVKKQLSSELRDDMHAWRWGKVHQIEFKNPIRRSGFGKSLLGGKRFTMSGSNETLYRSVYKFQKPEEVTISAALRMVVDLNDDDKFLAVIPGGVTGRTFDSHFKDQLKDYMSGKKVFWWFSDQMIKEHQKFKQLFVP